MNDNDKLISIWKSNKAIIDHDTSISLNQNIDTMNTIIQFENREKNEKNTQIYAALALALLTGLFLYEVDLSRMHLFGIILLLIGVAYNIIANRTDNFPDFKQLKTIDYLKEFRDSTLKRNRMHKINLVIGLIFLVPGCYLTFRDSFPQLGIWWIPIMSISASITAFLWFVKYNRRSAFVIEEVSELMNDFISEKKS